MINENKIREVCTSDPDRGFRMLVDSFQEPIYWHIRRLVVSHEDAEDIIQEAFVLYWGNRVNFNSLLAVKAYLFSIVRNKVMAQIRDVANRKRILDRIEREEGETGDHLLITAEICGEVQRAVRELPPQTRRVIELSMEDMTVERIAEVMQISPNTVKTLKKAGYQALREKLKHLRVLLPFLFMG